MYIPIKPSLPEIEPWDCPVGSGLAPQEYDPITGACGDQVNNRSWKWVLGTIGVLFFWYFPIWLFGEPQGYLIVKAWLAKKCPQWFDRTDRTATPVPSEVELATLGGRNSDDFSQPDQSVAGDFPNPHPELCNYRYDRRPYGYDRGPYRYDRQPYRYDRRPVFGPEPDPDRIEFIPPVAPELILPHPEYHVSA
jgi:hypothetical protein